MGEKIVREENLAVDQIIARFFVQTVDCVLEPEHSILTKLEVGFSAVVDEFDMALEDEEKRLDLLFLPVQDFVWLVFFDLLGVIRQPEVELVLFLNRDVVQEVEVLEFFVDDLADLLLKREVLIHLLHKPTHVRLLFLFGVHDKATQQNVQIKVQLVSIFELLKPHAFFLLDGSLFVPVKHDGTQRTGDERKNDDTEKHHHNCE